LLKVEILYIRYNDDLLFRNLFDDDLFTFSKAYVREFCKAYKKISDIPFVVNGHFHYFDEDRARYLADANCRIIKFGIESGSEYIRKKILNRHMKNELIIDKIRIAKQFDLHSSVFIIIGFPYEKKEDVLDTIRLTAKAKPGRFRWTKFFPYPGTEAAQLSLDGGYVDLEKMGGLMNFTDESCLDFGHEHNLFLEKAGLVFPWFVNAYSDMPVADFYARKIDEILAMDKDEWRIKSKGFLEEDRRISADFIAKGESHYAFKYNTFTGVISDYFLNEG